MGDLADDAHRAEEREELRQAYGDGARGKHRNRSRSGAHTECPQCLKKVRGAKGLKRHLADVHGES